MQSRRTDHVGHSENEAGSEAQTHAHRKQHVNYEDAENGAPQAFGGRCTGFGVYGHHGYYDNHQGKDNVGHYEQLHVVKAGLIDDDLQGNEAQQHNSQDNALSNGRRTPSVVEYHEDYTQDA